MAGTVVADQLEAASTSTLVLKNGVANTPPTVQDSAGTQIGTFCRAWVNFNGTGTVAIRASFNVSSITDNGTGDYTVNFSAAFADANYCTNGFAWASAKNAAAIMLGQPATSTNPQTAAAVRVSTHDNMSESVLFDATVVNVAVFR